MFREWLVWSVGFIAPQRLDRSGPVAWGCRPPTASGLASITELAGWCEARWMSVRRGPGEETPDGNLPI